MANNPIDTNEFSFFLEFAHSGYPSEYEICEPVGWDACNFIQAQEPKRWARSSEGGAVDKLTFVDAYGIQISQSQQINPQGDIYNHLDYGLFWLLPGYKQFGFQFKVSFIIKRNGLEFNRQQLDFSDKEITDGYTYVSVKLIQKGKVANLKRRLDDKFNLFGTVDSYNNAITPAPTVDFLRIATPETNKSIFNGNGTPASSLSQTAPNGLGTLIAKQRRGVNNANKIIEYEINNTLSFLSPVYATVLANDILGNTYPVPNDSLSFTFLEAKNDLSNVQIDITNVSATSNALFQSFGSTTILTGSGYAKLLVVVGNDLETEPFTVYELWNRNFLMQVGFDNSPKPVPTSFSLNIPAVERGKRIYIYFASDTDATFNNLNSSLAGARVFVNMVGMDIKFTATETAINTIVKGVRWIDGIKQADKFGSNIGVNAPLFENGGVHYDNVIFGRRQISQKVDTFTSTPKIIFESVEEVNCDSEPDENEIFIDHQKGFYENVEIGVFNVIPDEDFSIQENDRCMINKFQYKYKTYQQDRTVNGTANAIHTESEWRFLNDQVENVKEVALEFVRDPFTIQAMVDLEVSQPSTSTSEDDKVYVSEIISLAPSAFNEFGARLLMRLNDGVLEILNRDSNGDSGNVVINWTILGISVNDIIQITFGENVGSYQVYAITNSVISLIPQLFTPTFEGDGFIRLKYFYTNVLWVTRTNEGFVSNPNGLQNANYSIKRNMDNHFGEYFASCLLYEKKNIINGYFKSNGAFTSQLTIESAPVVENANILHSSLPNPLITPKVYTHTCVAEFEDILAYLNAYKVNRGFVRCLDSYGRVIKGFVQKLDHLWQENKLKLVIEEKFETENLILTYSTGVLTVNDAQYNLFHGITQWWKFDNDYIKLYDAGCRPLSNFYRFDFVELNGVTYDSKADLVTALLSLA